MVATRRNVVTDVVRGGLAGAVATWVMGKTTTYLYEHEDEGARLREDAARGGKTAYVVAAEKGAALIGLEITGKQEQALGSAIHWAIGIMAGALYGGLRGHIRGIDRGQGTAYGAAFWLCIDEGANPLLGLTPGPRAFPWQTHARGFAGHLVFGLVTETLLDATDTVTTR